MDDSGNTPASGGVKRKFWDVAFDDVEAGRVSVAEWDPNNKECWLALAGLTEPDMNVMTETQKWQRLTKEYGGHLGRHLLALSEMGVPKDVIRKKAPMLPRKWDQWVAQAAAHKKLEDLEAAQAALATMTDSGGIGGSPLKVPSTPEGASIKKTAVDAAAAAVKRNEDAAAANAKMLEDRLAADATKPAKRTSGGTGNR